MTCVIVHSWRLPTGYTPDSTDLLLRLAPGFPDVAPDMYWCDPPVRLANGAFPVAADLMESHLGRTWQRFSRHLSPGQWISGRDDLASYLALIRRDLSTATVTR
jgi:hypothetical protein